METCLQVQLLQASKVAQFPSPLVWAQLIKLKPQRLAVLSEQIAEEDNNAWAQPPRGKFSVFYDITTLMETQLNAYKQQQDEIKQARSSKYPSHTKHTKNTPDNRP